MRFRLISDVDILDWLLNETSRLYCLAKRFGERKRRLIDGDAPGTYKIFVNVDVEFTGLIAELGGYRV